VFSYEAAFDRNIGWLTAEEQQALRSKRIAIAGMGGVGGVYLTTLVRLGIGAFNLADFDTFDLPNFNRQAGAMLSTLGRSKVDVMSAQALDINPELDLRRFPHGVDASNVDEFLTGCDLYVDGLDFFAFEARSVAFARCSQLGIPATTAAPLGMGAALINFRPDGMTFEEYFDWRGQSDDEKALRLAVGVAPIGPHRRYLVVPEAVDMVRQRVPSTAMACQICAGVVATEALKILLGRGYVRYAPHAMQFDAYSGRLLRTWRPGGNRHPLQRVAIALGRRMLQRAVRERRPG